MNTKIYAHYKILVKLTAILMVLALICIGFWSCKADPSGETNGRDSTPTGGSNSMNGSEDAGNTETKVKHDLPDNLKFSGETFNILYPLEWPAISNYSFAESLNGEIFNDAMYNRVLAVEERLDITINPIGKGTISTIYSDMQTAARSGMNEYQLVLAHSFVGLQSIFTGGLAANFQKMPNIDMNKPYWYKWINEDLTFNGIQLAAANSFIMMNPCVMLFNKDMIMKYDLGDPYGLVDNNKWTWDAFAEMAKAVTLDLDGDGVYTDKDQYGFAAPPLNFLTRAILQSSGMKSVYYVEETDSLELGIENERFYALMDKLHDLFYVGNQTFVGTHLGNASDPLSMTTGRVLFFPIPLVNANEFRASDINYGILPYPKASEDQDRYWMITDSGHLVVPKDANLELTGAVCELLAYESYTNVLPVYYDIILTLKDTRDDESRRMIDIIYDGLVIDIGKTLGDNHAMAGAVGTLINSKTTNYASFIEANKSAFLNVMNKTIDAIKAGE